MLSQIAQLLYDLIGLLGPIIIKAKIFMQRLWQIKCDWDESVPPDIHIDWQNYRKDLTCINDLTFPRCVVIDEATNVQLHGFCDASEVAYGLLSKLVQSVLPILALKIDEIHLWSDSTITLQWINTEPYQLKTFVANRVSQIRETTDPLKWRHVPTNQNPADLLSRGQMPREFMQNAIWVSGPIWLSTDEKNWPPNQFEKVPTLELKANVNLLSNNVTKTQETNDILTKFSSIQKTKRVMAFCMRFIDNIRINLQAKGKKGSKTQAIVNSGIKDLRLSVEEIQTAMNKILVLLQTQFFSRELKALQNNEKLPRSSSLFSLDPFVGKDGLLRVGGRLKHSTLSYNEIHPIVLPKSHHITISIIRFKHQTNYHSGAQATLNAVRSNYWPINGMNTVKKVIRKCMTCFRAKPANLNYLMDNLPKERVTQTRLFVITGVDYCGPFFIKEKKHRNRNKVKAYVAIFVCFATKACHIELVSDLTTETFIACLKRFFARRGKSSTIFSDNGTNFVGTNNELTKTLRELIDSENHKAEVLTYLEKQGIKWKFSPPNSPHFGGLWEAAVKSFKYLFIRSIGEKLFSFEELITFTTEIEAILNSRPITPLSSDPNDLRSLSPSHFLIGDSLMSVPEHNLTDIPENRVSNWQNIQRVKQLFWNRWYKEYLNQLNIRCKWQHAGTDNPKVGTMVIIKKDNTPPLRWHLGRIIKIHPGDDSIVRVVTVRTTTGIYKRSVKRVVSLPID
ncbi:uncharacterized protein LOC122499595 [Leptopilina heterotoma]|uniref:uncharacterized protein LOC122499595 n=1 Tax=Leptopilina heterotoma TaxID=63436 RepID=UPI001CA8D721|nr:uncharacterized protein LOC122499595 [Leptopilina heterotoma]